eukprot:134297-Amorphochlora_amoeboformis.AAC.1
MPSLGLALALGLDLTLELALGLGDRVSVRFRGTVEGYQLRLGQGGLHGVEGEGCWVRKKRASGLG